MKVLFITSTRIGDAVLSTSIFNHIIKKFPWAQISVATGNLPSILFRNFKNTKSVIVMEKTILKTHWIKLWFQTFFTKWDIVIDLRGSILGYLIFTKKKYVYRSFDKNIHRLAELAILMKTKDLPLPYIPILKKDLIIFKKEFSNFRNFIAVGASANWRAKTWSAKKFTKLIKLLLKDKKITEDKNIAFFGSKLDIKDAKKIIKNLKKCKIKNFCGKLNLVETYTYLSQCKIFIGNDSGLMHLSASTGVPTLGLFGPSLETRYAPKGEKSFYIRTKKSYKQLTGKKNFDWNTKSNLMNSLSVKSVYKKVKKILK